jgi:hypothetical protein
MRQFKQKTSELLRLPYLMAVTHLSKCGKWKLKIWLVIATRLQLRAKRGRGEADVAIQDMSSLREGEAGVAIQVV